MSTLRIVIADDQASVREGLVLLLGGLPDIDVVGAAADGEQALALVAEHAPDAILLDLHMPVLDGVATAKRLAAEHPDVAVVVLTTYADDQSVLDAMHAGARSYLTKDADRAHIAQALHAAAGGLTVFDPRAHRAGDRVRPGRSDPAGGGDPAAHRARADEPGDRGAAVPEQSHDQDAHQPDLRQDRVTRPGRRHRLRAPARPALTYSHSIVPGGLLVMSSTTRLTSGTSLVIRPEILASTGSGTLAQSAVIASSLVTGRSTTG
jgi:DNA-binding NarL/FixJ family response regulator